MENTITQIAHNYHRPGGLMITPTLTLTPDTRGDYVTWANGKRQIRTTLKAAGYKAVGLFRARKVNKNEFHIICVRENKTYACTAQRKPNATFTFTHLG